MATTTNNKKTLKTAAKSAPTYNRKNGKVKAAFNVPAKAPARAKVKHYLPAAIRPHLMKIGRNIDQYITLCHDLTTEPLLRGSYAGYVESKNADFKKDAAALSYFLTLAVSTLARYDFSKGFPAITEKDSGYILDYLHDGFSTSEYNTRKEYCSELATFEDMALTALALSSVVKGYAPGDFDYMVGRFNMVLNIKALAHALFHLYDKERAEIMAGYAARDAKELEDRTVITDLNEYEKPMPLEIADALYGHLLHHTGIVQKDWQCYAVKDNEAGRKAVFATKELAQKFKDNLATYFPMFIKDIAHLVAPPEMRIYLKRLIDDCGLYPKE